MFGGTVWTVVSQRSTDRVNRKIFAVACTLLLLSTVVRVFSFAWMVIGQISYRYTAYGDRHHKNLRWFDSVPG